MLEKTKEKKNEEKTKENVKDIRRLEFSYTYRNQILSFCNKY